MTSISRIKQGSYWDHALYLTKGCTKTDISCKNCWAELLANRFKYFKEFNSITNQTWNGNITFDESLLQQKLPAKPSTYSIWNDLFHEKISQHQINTALAFMCSKPQHTFLVLTKRPTRLESCLLHFFSTKHPSLRSFSQSDLKNVWFGTSIYSSDPLCVSRVDFLTSIHKLSTNLFLSIEPMLNSVDINKFNLFHKIKLAIIGCESGPSRRIAPNQLLLNLQEQLTEKNTTTFVKQWDFGKGIIKLPYGSHSEYSQLPF